MQNSTIPTEWNLAMYRKITYTFAFYLSSATSWNLFQRYTEKIQNPVCRRLFVRALFTIAEKTGNNTKVHQ